MAKKKSKAKKNPSSVLNTENGASALDNILKSNMLKDIGVAIAGVVVGELLDQAFNRLTHKTTANQDVERDGADLEIDQDNQSHRNPVKQAVLAVTEDAADIKDSVKNSVAEAASDVRQKGTDAKDAIYTLRSTVSELTPDLSDVVAALKDVAQQSIQKSGRATEETTNNAAETVASTAKSVIGAVNSGVKEKKSKKDKKQKKKKNKKSLDTQSLVRSR